MNQVNSGIRINWTVLWTDQSKGYNNFKDGNGFNPFLLINLLLVKLYDDRKRNRFVLAKRTSSSLAHKKLTWRNLGSKEYDQLKVTKCLWNLPKNDFERKIKDFDTFTEIAKESWRFGQINCCLRLWKVAKVQ